MRFFALAVLIYRFGDPIRVFIDRYFNLLAWISGIVLVLGFVMIEVLL